MTKTKSGLASFLIGTILPVSAFGRVLEPKVSEKEAQALVETALAELERATASSEKLCALNVLFQFRNSIQDSNPDLMAALEDSSTEVRLLATLTLLGAHGLDSELESRLEQNTRSENPQLVLASLMALADSRPVDLADYGIKETTDLLVPHLLTSIRQDRRLTVSTQAWDLLSQVYPAYSVELVEVVANFFSRRRPPSTEIILVLFSDGTSQDPAKSRRAQIILRALAQVEPSTIAEIVNIAIVGSVEERTVALHGLMLMRVQEKTLVIPAFLRGLQSRSLAVQRAAIEGIGVLRLGSAETLLIDLVKAAPTWREAAISLAGINGSALERLAHEIQQTNPAKSLEIRKILLESRL